MCIRLVIRRSIGQFLLDRQHSCMEIDRIFCGHSLPSADSRRTDCQFLVKECVRVLVNHLEDKACPGKSVVTG